VKSEAGGATYAAAADDASLELVAVGSLARRDLVLETVQPGQIEPLEEAPLYAKVAGYVGELLVDIGDEVTEGKVLLRLSAPEMADDVQQAEALLAQAEAEAVQAEAAVTAAAAARETAAATVEQMQAGVSRAGAACTRWQSEYERIRRLSDAGTVTAKLADETEQQLRSAEAACQEASAAKTSAEADLRAAVANIAKAEADRLAAGAKVRVAGAALARAKTMLSYLEIKAPFAGVVSSRSVDRGHYVQPSAGGEPLLTITRTDMVRVLIDVPEAEAALVDAGDPATVVLQTSRREEFPGTVTRDSWALDRTNRSLRVAIDLENPEGRLRTGMYVTACICLEQHDDALVAPPAAISWTGREPACFVIDDAGTLHRRSIEVGLRLADAVEVQSGIAADEAIVLAKADSLRDGQTVRPEAAKP
jgi:RND family efflux transporter MFP subunit